MRTYLSAAFPYESPKAFLARERHPFDVGRAARSLSGGIRRAVLRGSYEEEGQIILSDSQFVLFVPGPKNFLI